MKQPIKKGNIGFNAVDLKGKPSRINPQETRLFAGGRFLIYDRNLNAWKRSGEPVRDFCTLFRIAILHKLINFGGLSVRQFISENGELIYFILHTPDAHLKLKA
jgi:hypothetical protein